MIGNIASPSNRESTFSLWHSPIAYLIGGLGAIMALLAFALCILACCNWKRPRGSLEENNLRSEQHRESNIGRCGEENELMKNITSASSNDERVVVIMGGDETPTFITVSTSASPV